MMDLASQFLNTLDFQIVFISVVVFAAIAMAAYMVFTYNTGASYDEVMEEQRRKLKEPPKNKKEKRKKVGKKKAEEKSQSPPPSNDEGKDSLSAERSKKPGRNKLSLPAKQNGGATTHDNNHFAAYSSSSGDTSDETKSPETVDLKEVLEEEEKSPHDIAPAAEEEVVPVALQEQDAQPLETTTMTTESLEETIAPEIVKEPPLSAGGDHPALTGELVISYLRSETLAPDNINSIIDILVERRQIVSPNCAKQWQQQLQEEKSHVAALEHNLEDATLQVQLGDERTMALRRQQQGLEAACSDLARQKEQLAQEKQQLQAELHQKVSELNTNLGRTQAMLADNKNKMLQSEASFSQELQKCRSATDAMRQKIQDKDYMLSSKEQELQEAQSRHQQLAQQSRVELDRLQLEKEQMKEEHANNIAHYASLMEQLQKQIGALQEEARNSKNQVVTLAEEKRALREEQAETENRLRELTSATMEKIQNAEAEAATLRQQLHCVQAELEAKLRECNTAALEKVQAAETQVASLKQQNHNLKAFHDALNEFYTQNGFGDKMPENVEEMVGCLTKELTALRKRDAEHTRQAVDLAAHIANYKTALETEELHLKTIENHAKEQVSSLQKKESQLEDLRCCMELLKSQNESLNNTLQKVLASIKGMQEVCNVEIDGEQEDASKLVEHVVAAFQSKLRLMEEQVFSRELYYQNQLKDQYQIWDRVNDLSQETVKELNDTKRRLLEVTHSLEEQLKIGEKLQLQLQESQEEKERIKTEGLKVKQACDELQEKLGELKRRLELEYRDKAALEEALVGCRQAGRCTAQRLEEMEAGQTRLLQLYNQSEQQLEEVQQQLERSRGEEHRQAEELSRQLQDSHKELAELKTKMEDKQETLEDLRKELAQQLEKTQAMAACEQEVLGLKHKLEKALSELERTSRELDHCRICLHQTEQKYNEFQNEVVCKEHQLTQERAKIMDLETRLQRELEKNTLHTEQLEQANLQLQGDLALKEYRLAEISDQLVQERHQVMEREQDRLAKLQHKFTETSAPPQTREMESETEPQMMAAEPQPQEEEKANTDSMAHPSPLDGSWIQLDAKEIAELHSPEKLDNVEMEPSAPSPEGQPVMEVLADSPQASESQDGLPLASTDQQPQTKKKNNKKKKKKAKK